MDIDCCVRLDYMATYNHLQQFDDIYIYINKIVVETDEFFSKINVSKSNHTVKLWN